MWLTSYMAFKKFPTHTHTHTNTHNEFLDRFYLKEIILSIMLEKSLIAILVNNRVLCIFRCLLPWLCTMESVLTVERSLTGRSSVLLCFLNSFCLEEDVSCVAVRREFQRPQSPPIKAEDGFWIDLSRQPYCSETRESRNNIKEGWLYEIRKWSSQSMADFCKKQ